MFEKLAAAQLIHGVQYSTRGIGREEKKVEMHISHFCLMQRSVWRISLLLCCVLHDEHDNVGIF